MAKPQRHNYERRVVRVDLSPMNPRVKVVQLSCGHDLYRGRRPRLGAVLVCDHCFASRAEATS